MSLDDTVRDFQEAVVSKKKYKVQINASAFAYTYVEVEGTDESDAIEAAYELLEDNRVLDALVRDTQWNYVLDDCSPFEIDEAIEIG